MNSATIVQKLWNYCNVLRDDGMSYGDYVEQLTYLLFLKMADDRSRPPYKQPSLIPAPYAWPELLKRDGDDLFDHYRHTLERLGAEKGTLGLIFNKAQYKFQNPAKLRHRRVPVLRTQPCGRAQPRAHALHAQDQSDEARGSGRIRRLLQPGESAPTQGDVVRHRCPSPRPLPASGAREEGLSGRWRAYDYDALIARDKASLDIFWLRDDARADSDNLPPPDVIAQEIVDDLEAALEQFRLIAGDLGSTEATE